MIIVPFEREHLERMVVQQQQQGLEHLLTDDLYDVLVDGQSYTVMDGDEVLICGGAMEISPGRAVAWAYLARQVGVRMSFITRAVRRFLGMLNYRRIEIDVDCDFEQAHRWAKMLGFTMECERRRSFSPDGRDCALYAMVKG